MYSVKNKPILNGIQKHQQNKLKVSFTFGRADFPMYSVKLSLLRSQKLGIVLKAKTDMIHLFIELT